MHSPLDLNSGQSAGVHHQQCMDLESIDTGWLNQSSVDQNPKGLDRITVTPNGGNVRNPKSRWFRSECAKVCEPLTYVGVQHVGATTKQCRDSGCRDFVKISPVTWRLCLQDS